MINPIIIFVVLFRVYDSRISHPSMRMLTFNISDTLESISDLTDDNYIMHSPRCMHYGMLEYLQNYYYWNTLLKVTSAVLDSRSTESRVDENFNRSDRMKI